MPATGDRITKRKHGLFQKMYTAQTPDSPKRKYIYGRKKKDVERRLAEAMGDAARGIVFDADTLTVGQWLDFVALRRSKAARGRRQDGAQHLRSVRGHRSEAPKAHARAPQAQRPNPRRSPQAVRYEGRDSFPALRRLRP